MTETTLTVGDVKQLFYCPRIVYFRRLVPRFRSVTHKMREGKLRQSEEVRRERRRKVGRFGLTEGTKLFDLALASEELGLSGVVDMAILLPEEVIPVDFKDGSFSLGKAVALHHKYQLLAYGILLEAQFGKRAARGFVCSLEDGSVKAVPFTEGARRFLFRKLEAMRAHIAREELPEETPHRGRCRECEFSLFCKG